MAWGSKTQIMTSASVASTAANSTAVTMTPGELSHVQLIANSNGTTSNLDIGVYGTLDASTENWDTVPLYQFTLDCTDGNDNDVSFVVPDIYKWRLTCERANGSDTITVNAYYRDNNIDL